MNQRYDAIVIGAGMSGLAAGIRLAQFEKRVVVLERHSLWGGLNSFYKRGGRRIDTGLHALTNCAPREDRSSPLARLLRQLRIPRERLRLAEQGHSEIVFPSARLAFENGIGRLEAEVARAFPAERDGFARLVRAVREHDPFRDPGGAPADPGARAVLAGLIAEPLLREMLLAPVSWYGSAREDDVDWDAFVVLFRSIFLEGLARPEGGIKTLLDLLLGRLRECGGELRTNAGVERVVVERGRAVGVELAGGEVLESERVFSSAGLVETLALAGLPSPPAAVGRLSFVETVVVLDRPHRALGHEATMTFFSTSDRLSYRRPDALVDLTGGVVCCSDNYRTPEPPTEGVQRVSVLADHDRWSALGEADYRAEKRLAAQRIHALAARYAPDPRRHARFEDLFTPRTIRRYTGHAGGAIYGSPAKRRDGSSGIENLVLIGTDQGLCGIVGALLSGITMANRHVLVAP